CRGRRSALGISASPARAPISPVTTASTPPRSSPPPARCWRCDSPASCLLRLSMSFERSSGGARPWVGPSGRPMCRRRPGGEDSSRGDSRSRVEPRVSRASSTGSAADFLPEYRTLATLREAAAGCRGCPLWARATQTVFGEGPRRARVMMVGEQPGHDEDLAGKPFVGPAGRVLDRALEADGIARTDVYVTTNVVKHFKWEPNGKRRIHATSDRMEIAACLPWLEAELDVIEPVVLVCLGATAARTLIGPRFRVTRQRGEWVRARWAPHVMATVHPSAILRAPDDATRRAEMERFVADLKRIPPVLAARAA